VRADSAGPEEQVAVKALLVIDMQKGVYADEDDTVQGGDSLVATINGLIATARAAGRPLVFVQHEAEWLIAGSPQWELVDEPDARGGSDLFARKRHGSAFHESALERTLRGMGVDEIIVCGLQSEFCIDSTVRHAHTLGFPVTLAADAHSTWDSPSLTAAQIIEHHNRALAAYVDVTPSAAIAFDV
jgi:nicotinamidase-related amidase